MDVETAVTTNPAVALLGFLGVVILLLLLIARWRWHVFLALLVPLLLFGVLPGVAANNFIAAFERGFGNTLGSIGVVIVLGSLIAEGLRHTGAIQTITASIAALIGRHRMPLALTAAGFVIGFAIFSDVAYVILNPIVHQTAKLMGVPIGVASIGLVGSLQLSHAIVPPTPGPLAAAALVGADLGKTIIFGAIVCAPGALAAWIWGQFIAGPRIRAQPSAEFTADAEGGDSADPARRPGTLASYAPIAAPIVLISAQSVSQLFLEDGHVVRDILVFVGWPVVGLSVGVAFTCALLRTPDQWKAVKGGWVEEALRVSAMILVVTGLGGALSEILKGTPAVETISAFFAYYGLPSILLPFVIGVVGNMITGSTTVGVITAASLVAPALGGLGLSPEAAMLSGACGSVIIKYMNSSYFWVCTSLTGMRAGQGVIAYGGATLFGGLTSFAAVCALWAAGVL